MKYYNLEKECLTKRYTNKLKQTFWFYATGTLLLTDNSYWTSNTKKHNIHDASNLCCYNKLCNLHVVCFTNTYTHIQLYTVITVRENILAIYGNDTQWSNNLPTQWLDTIEHCYRDEFY